MSDLIERLRKWGEGESLTRHFLGTKSAREDCAEAATALAEAEAEIARLRGLLGEAHDVIENGWGTEQTSPWEEKAYFALVPRLSAELSRPHATKGEAG